MPQAAGKVLITGDAAKPRVKETAERALPIIKEQAEVVAVDLDGSLDLSSAGADLIVGFGGDGAILKAVRRLSDNRMAVCGVNLGKLGFLATLTDADVEQTLPSVLAGEYSASPAMTLDCSVLRDGSTVHSSRAMNDAVISRGALSRIVPVDLLIDGDRVTRYNGDGIVVSTPLGSTAHSLSAGGPIVQPDVEAMVLTPICPHTLSNRPLVVSAARRIGLRIADGPPGAALTVDGQVFHELETGDEVSVQSSGLTFELVRAPGHDYFRTLRDKLSWSGNLGSDVP
jgi:NAD+ kinase